MSGKHLQMLAVRLLLAANIVCALCGAGWAGRDKTWELDIPRQKVDAALTTLAEQTGTQLLFPYDMVASRDASPLKGRYTLDEALEIILRGTGLTGGVTSSGVITISLESAAKSREQGDDMEREKKKGILGAVAAAVLSVFSAQNATGQESEEARSIRGALMLEEIIVTATKREANVQDIPMSIAVIGNEDIERRGLIGMEDYLRSIPGVNQIDQGPASNAIVIRGITTSPQFENFATSTTVASYFGETPITAAAGMGAGGIDMRPVDIERIEILRGPQGTAYGSASLGGTMRMIPAKPKLDGFGARLAGSLSATSGRGSENWMGQGVVNIPILEDKFALRAVAYRYDESGFYRNIAGIDPGTIAVAESHGLGDYVRGHVQDDVGRIRSSGGRLAALWQPADNLRFSLTFLAQKIEQDGWPAETVGNYEQTRFPVAPRGRVRGEAGEIADTEIDLLNLELNYDLGWAELTSAVSWIDSGSTWAESNNFDNGYSSTAPSDFKSFTAETRLASQLEGRFQFLGGLFYEDVDDHFRSTFDWPGTPATNPFGIGTLFDVARQLDQRAVFGEVSYELTDKLTAMVGGRYFKYEKNERNLSEGGLVGIPIGGGIPQFLESSEDGSISKINLNYKSTNDSLLYASWSEGFRLGKPTPGLSPALCDTDGDGLVDGTGFSIESTKRVDSDFLENYEIGGKFNLLDRRIVVETSIYHIKWHGMPIRQVVRSGACNTSFLVNAGEATSDGVEFQAGFFVAESLRLDFGAGYNKAELSKDAPGLGEEGARLPGSPEVNASLSVQYAFETAGYEAYVRADSFYTGEFYGDLQETPDSRAGDYIKVDARVGVEIGNLSVELFARNLTDEDAFTWRRVALDGDYRLRPRTVGVQLDYGFE